MVVFGQKWFYSVKVVLLGKKLLYSDKNSCISESGYIWEKVVVFGQKWLYSGKMVVFGQSGFYKGNVVVNWSFYLGKSC